MKWKWALAVLIVVTYNSWVFASWLNPNPRALTGYLSELAAKDQPFHWFFRTADSVLAVLVCAVAFLGWRGWRSWLGSMTSWASIMLGVVSLATIADAIFAMPCSTTFNQTCKAEATANPFGMEHFLHTVASVCVGLGLIGSVLAVMIGRRRVHDSRQVKKVFIFGVILGASLLGSVAMEMTVGFGQGYIQAVQVLAASGWFAWLALRLGEYEPGE